MPETLLSPSMVFLFGRKLLDLELKGYLPHGRGSNQFLSEQLGSNQGGEAGFARIYGFSFEGHYYDLSRPTIFLVHGVGHDAEPPPIDGDFTKRYSRGPQSPDRTGTGARYGSFSDEMKVWCYDKGDFGLRFDVESGPFEQILLEAEIMSRMNDAHYSAAKVSGPKVSGGMVGGGMVGGGMVGGKRGGNRGD